MARKLPHGWTGWNNAPLVLFHGTTSSAAQAILSAVDVGRGETRRDFGQGFYTTTYKEQAIEWAEQKALTAGGDGPAVVQLTLERLVLGSFNHLVFIRGGYHAEDYWKFIFHCRDGHSHMIGQEGYYDVVYGPVAQVWTNPLQRRIFPQFDQISFHTQKAQAILNDKQQCEKEIVRWVQ